MNIIDWVSAPVHPTYILLYYSTIDSTLCYSTPDSSLCYTTLLDSMLLDSRLDSMLLDSVPSRTWTTLYIHGAIMRPLWLSKLKGNLAHCVAWQVSIKGKYWAGSRSRYIFAELRKWSVVIAATMSTERHKSWTPVLSIDSCRKQFGNWKILPLHWIRKVINILEGNNIILRMFGRLINPFKHLKYIITQRSYIDVKIIEHIR